jgi:transposase-like protein
VLQAEVTEHLGADRYERSDARSGYRHGSYERELTTCVGRLTLEVPRCKDGSFSTKLFDQYQRSEYVPTAVGESPRSGANGIGA